jgi:hypothetical protein
MRWAGNVARRGKKSNSRRSFVAKLEEQRILARPWLRWYDSIKTYLKAMGWGNFNEIKLAQEENTWRALGNKAMNFLVS